MGLKIAVTGGICTGKSVVAKALGRALDLEVVNLDEIAHRVLGKGTPWHLKVLEAFGPGVLDSKGEIDRKALGRIVFSDHAKRQLLEGIVHPEVEREVRRILEKLGGRAVIEAPLLIEKGTQGEVDVVVLVFCKRERQIERLRQRDGLSLEEATARIQAQMPLEEKVAWAHYLVNNDFSLAYTEEQVRRISLDILKKTEGGRAWRP